MKERGGEEKARDRRERKGGRGREKEDELCDVRPSYLAGLCMLARVCSAKRKALRKGGSKRWRVRRSRPVTLSAMVAQM